MSFRGASADAYAALTGSLQGALSGGADAAQVGSDLFSVAEVLRGQPALRRVATDVSVDSAAKVGLVNGLFGGKLSPKAGELLAEAVAHRWTQPRDLALALEELSVVATVASAGSESERLASELHDLDQVLETSPDLRSALSDPARSVQDKRTLIRGLLEGKVLTSTLTLADQALAGSHRTISDAISAYQQLAAQAHGQKVATVTVAQQLNESDQARLAAALQRQYDRDIQLNVVVDPNVIGGVRVEIGDDVIDGTVANRLDDARRKLAV